MSNATPPPRPQALTELKLASEPAKAPRFDLKRTLRRIWAQTKSSARESLSVRSALIVFCSAAVTALGFFSESFGLWLAYLPFLLALFTGNSTRRAVLAFGHFAVIAGISCWGLIALGYAPWMVIAAGVAGALTIGILYGVLGVAIASIVLLALPYMPGNPLLITGAIFPGTGFYGVAAVLCLCFVATSRRMPYARIFILCFAPVVVLFFWDMQNDTLGRFIGTAPDPERTTALTGFKPMTVSTGSAQLTRWEMQLALAKLEPGSTIITGENAVQAEDTTTIRTLCRTVRIRDLTLYLGVQAKDGRAEVHLFDAQNCDEGKLIYRAVLGIPGLTGPATPDLTMVLDPGGQGTAPPAAAPAFLACFEAFSVHRWAALALNGRQAVATVSNDHWTQPLPVDLLRRKVSRQLARLFQMDVAHTNTWAPTVWLLRKDRQAS